jgi:excisionase family DNA binding protein
MSNSQTYTLAETASLVGVSERTIQRWVKERKFVRPLTSAGMTMRFAVKDVDAWVRGAADVVAALRDLVAALATMAHDPEASPADRMWAAGRLAELSMGDPLSIRVVERMAATAAR